MLGTDEDVGVCPYGRTHAWCGLVHAYLRN
jgi:hypothetical protein